MSFVIWETCLCELCVFLTETGLRGVKVFEGVAARWRCKMTDTQRGNVFLHLVVQNCGG